MFCPLSLPTKNASSLPASSGSALITPHFFRLDFDVSRLAACVPLSFSLPSNTACVRSQQLEISTIIFPW